MLYRKKDVSKLGIYPWINNAPLLLGIAKQVNKSAFVFTECICILPYRVQLPY